MQAHAIVVLMAIHVGDGRPRDVWSDCEASCTVAVEHVEQSVVYHPLRRVPREEDPLAAQPAQDASRIEAPRITCHIRVDVCRAELSTDRERHRHGEGGRSTAGSPSLCTEG